MRPPDEPPEFLTPDQRLRDLAAILARGVLRLHSRAALTTNPGPHADPEKPQNSSENRLELPAIPRLSVTRGLTARETPETPKPEDT